MKFVSLHKILPVSFSSLSFSRFSTERPFLKLSWQKFLSKKFLAPYKSLSASFSRLTDDSSLLFSTCDVFDLIAWHIFSALTLLIWSRTDLSIIFEFQSYFCNDISQIISLTWRLMIIIEYFMRRFTKKDICISTFKLREMQLCAST